jgi:hypothetical protein
LPEGVEVSYFYHVAQSVSEMCRLLRAKLVRFSVAAVDGELVETLTATLDTFDIFRSIHIVQEVPFIEGINPAYEHHHIIICVFIGSDETSPVLPMVEADGWSGSCQVDGFTFSGPLESWLLDAIELYFSIRQSIVEDWCGGALHATHNYITTQFDAALTTLQTVEVWDSPFRQATSCEYISYYYSLEFPGEGAGAHIVTVGPVAFPAQVTAGGVDVSGLTSAVQDLSKRDVTFSLSNNGPHISVFGRSSTEE